jgi:hypothetical protein
MAPDKRTLDDLSPTRDRRPLGSVNVSPAPKKKAPLPKNKGGRPKKQPGGVSTQRGALDPPTEEGMELTGRADESHYLRLNLDPRRKSYKETDATKERSGRAGGEQKAQNALAREAERDIVVGVPRSSLDGPSQRELEVEGAAEMRDLTVQLEREIMKRQKAEAGRARHAKANKVRLL